jgi:lipopolysaccharide transport system ATP-binding protein
MSSDHDRDVMISVRGLGKAYTIAHAAQKATTLAEAAVSRLRRPFYRPQQETFWALKDVSFDVRRGDVVGVIGRNGAGKSTLFKILSRITEPTTGQVDLYGRVGSLLEVGTGFSGELTGRENIYLNGTILGMRRAEIAKRFDEIIDFAGVEKFLDTPVKRYSSGMYVRLAFAVAAHLETEILVLDEVLAVGDVAFQNRCLGKVRQLSSDGRTVLFVSHNMQSITRLCDRAVYLRAGQVICDGSNDAGIVAYMEDGLVARGAVASAAERRPGTGELRLTYVRLANNSVTASEPKRIEFGVRRLRETGPAYISAHVVNDSGEVIAQCDSRSLGVWVPERAFEMRFVLTVASPWLKPGQYSIDGFICTPSASPIVDRFDSAAGFHVGPTLPYPEASPADALGQCAVLPDFQWERLPDRLAVGDEPVACTL